MSIFSELLVKIHDVSSCFTDFTNLQSNLEALEKIGEDIIVKARDLSLKKKNAKTTLQSINEDEDVPATAPAPQTRRSSKRSTDSKSSKEEVTVVTADKRQLKKRSRHEVEDMSSPDIDKRPKRNASVKAQGVISQQSKKKDWWQILSENDSALSSASKLVNVNLTSKMRRDAPATDMQSADKHSADEKRSSRRRAKQESDKENAAPVIQVKLEKVSLPQEVPTDIETENLELKKEVNTDEIAMPPPAVPVPKPRGRHKAKELSKSESDEEGGRRKTARGKKTDEPAPPVAAPRSTRASNRSTRASSRSNSRASTRASALNNINADNIDDMPPPPESRPKRTRTKKQVPEQVSQDSSQESAPTSPIEKPRPKRTRRGQKAADKEKLEAEKAIESKKAEEAAIKAKQAEEAAIKAKQAEEAAIKAKQAEEAAIKAKQAEEAVIKAKQAEEIAIKAKQAEKTAIKTKQAEEIAKNQEKATLTKVERISIPEVSSPILQRESKPLKGKAKTKKDEAAVSLEVTRVIAADVTAAICNGFDKTVTLSNGQFDDAPLTTKMPNMNETVVIDTVNRQTVLLGQIDPVNRQTILLDQIDPVNRETMVLDRQPAAKVMDTTVILDKEPPPANMTDDNSLITDDDSNGDGDYTPPRRGIPKPQPVSAVKEKVQQFEELATRVTRTKTRAKAKKEEEETEKQTPPDKICKVVLSADTLSKMNNLIFNGKPHAQISSSASKPRANIVTSVRSLLPATTSKLAGMARARETAEETQKREKEDARKKKEALLVAKKEQQKRKREEKIAAAAAAREAAERERQLQLEAAARERQEKQAHADQGKLERLKEVERKRQELARKVAETEERRRAEERARQARLAEEQRRADTQRKRQHDEQEAMKIEAAVMAKDLEKRQKEYNEKLKLKQKMDADRMNTPLRAAGTPSSCAPGSVAPVHMCDGFEQLNSDSEDEDERPASRPAPLWSTHKVRWAKLERQAALRATHIDRLFSVRVHSPDLRQIFPSIDRRALKRTSSAVWRTPPRLPALAE